MTKEKFLTLPQAAKLLQMNAEVLRRMLQRGDIKGFKVGKLWRIRESEIGRGK